MKKTIQRPPAASLQLGACFLLFTAAHFALSSPAPSLETRLYLFVFGLVLPGVWAAYLLRHKGTGAQSGPAKPDLLVFTLPWPFWALAALAALLLRFWDLGGADWWQRGDESLAGILAVELYRHWNWDLFGTFAQLPTTLSRFCCGLLYCTHAPLFSLQFSTAFFSAVSVPMGYLACRQYFSRSFSALAVLLLMSGFWPVWTARTGYPVSLFLFWELAVLYLLGKTLSAAPAVQVRNALLLGFATGLGPYTGTSWPVVAAFVALVLGWRLFRPESRKGAIFLAFPAAFLAALAPFLFCLSQGRYGGHIHQLLVWKDYSPVETLRQISAYVSALFWDNPPPSLQPGLGGILNGLLASCFLLGILSAPFHWKKGFPAAVVAGLLLSCLPAFLSKGFEILRIFPILPFLLAGVAEGIRVLALAFSPSRRTFFVAAVLLGSVLLDLPRLYPVHLRPSSGEQAAPFRGEGQDIFELLRPVFSKENPGLVFCGMIPEISDPSLLYASYFMNAADNPGLSAAGNPWAAVETDYHYEPFLSSRFPGSRWVSLSSPQPGLPGRRIVGFIPVNAQTSPVLHEWLAFYRPWGEINWKILDLANGLPRLGPLRDLLALYPSVPVDPFLQSCYFEKLLYNYSWEITFHPEDRSTAWGDYSGVFQASFQKSYRDGALCEKFGRLLAVEGQREEARKVFRQALKLSPGNDWLTNEMKQLGL